MRARFRRFCRNLISNALKFTPKRQSHGFGERCSRIKTFYSPSKTPASAFAPEHHETIFREFSQVENPLQERHRGTGLGLPLCRNLAMLLGGTDLAGKRSWQRFDLFRATSPRSTWERRSSRKTPLALPAPDFHRAPVLFLEDDPETAHYFEACISGIRSFSRSSLPLAQAEVWIARHIPAAVVADIYHWRRFVVGLYSTSTQSSARTSGDRHQRSR